MVYGGRRRTFGLLQHCAAYDCLPLTLFADRYPEAPVPLDDALVFHLVGAGKADPVFCNPIDLDVWLEMPALTIARQSFNHLDVVKEMGDTIGAHRDDGIGPFAHALQMVRSGGGRRYRGVESYAVHEARYVDSDIYRVSERRTAMADEKLDLAPLTRAIDRLSEGWVRYQQDTSDTQIRDGLIQRFEFTYEISHKMLKRHLEVTSANPAEFDYMSFQDLIRMGNERGLLSGGWPEWRNYRDMRAKTGLMT